MDSSKPWYQSHTIWASLVVVGASCLTLVGVITPEQAETLAGLAPAQLVTVATGLGGVWALWGRIRATTSIGSG